MDEKGYAYVLLEGNDFWNVINSEGEDVSTVKENGKYEKYNLLYINDNRFIQKSYKEYDEKGVVYGKQQSLIDKEGNILIADAESIHPLNEGKYYAVLMSQSINVLWQITDAEGKVLLDNLSCLSKWDFGEPTEFPLHYYDENNNTIYLDENLKKTEDTYDIEDIENTEDLEIEFYNLEEPLDDTSEDATYGNYEKYLEYKSENVIYDSSELTSRVFDHFVYLFDYKNDKVQVYNADKTLYKSIDFETSREQKETFAQEEMLGQEGTEDIEI